MLSGLPTLFSSYVQNVTWEGDNHVMFLQTARHLLKALAAGEAGHGKGASGGGSAAYLGDARREAAARCGVASEADWRDPRHQLAALRWGGGEGVGAAGRQCACSSV